MFVYRNGESLLKLLSEKYNFKFPEWVWLDASSNCMFNYVFQLYAKKHFGSFQHDAELSTLVRFNKLARELAVQIIETEMDLNQINQAQRIMGMTLRI